MKSRSLKVLGALRDLRMKGKFSSSIQKTDMFVAKQASKKGLRWIVDGRRFWSEWVEMESGVSGMATMPVTWKSRPAPMQ